MKPQNHQLELHRHYSMAFEAKSTEHIWTKVPPLPQTCRIFEFPPSGKTFCWVYSTCGMTRLNDSAPLELFLLSPCQTELHVELLTIIAHYHQTGERLDWSHTINFGRPWLANSACSFGLLSLPYTFGPKLERADIAGKHVRILWLIPITEEERNFKISSGLEALEVLFEKNQFDYLNPTRRSVTHNGIDSTSAS